MRKAAILLALVFLSASLNAPAALAERSRKRDVPTTVPVMVTLTPSIYAKVGVAQLMTATFSHPVVDRAAAERAITVAGSRPLPPGAWGWVGPQTAVYRPKTYWPAYTTITFDVRLGGVALGKRGNTTYVGSSLADDSYEMQTGRSLVLIIRNATHRLEVVRDGRRVATFPVSLGTRRFPTLRGIKVITDDNFRAFRMYGRDRSGGRYKVLAPYAIRTTASGEFIHGAPWANYRIGKRNGSHGCINMFVRHAKWLYQRVTAGDPVEIYGTERRMPVTDGRPGAYWNFNWRAWLRRSAAGAVQPAVAPAAVSVQ